MAYEVPDWAKVEEDVESEVEEEVEVEEKRNEFYCVACGKKFKSDKQWKNHEQSKKHKEKVAELRDAFSEEDRENEEEEEEDEDGFVSVDEVEKIKERFEGVEIQEEETGGDDESESDEEFVDVDDGEKEEDDNEDEEDDDEDSVLKAMLKNRKNVGNTRKQKAPKNVYVEAEVEEVDLMEYMEYNNTKGRRKRGGRKETAKKDEREEPEIVHEPEISSNVEADEKCDDGSHIEESLSSEPCAENGNNGGGDDAPTVKQAPPVKVSSKAKVPKQAPAVKVTNKKEVNSKPKKSTRGMKKKGTSTNSGHECDTCGVDFDSRNKLHKHLSDTGHAALKSR